MKVPSDIRRREYVRAGFNIGGNPALDVLIGLFFLYFLLSLVCSAINEAIAAVFRLRSQYLEKGLRHMLDGEQNLDAFFRNPRVQALVKPPGPVHPAEAQAVVHLVARLRAHRAGHVRAASRRRSSQDLIARARHALGPAAHRAPGAPATPAIVARMLQDALDEEREHIDRFRRSIERSFDHVMDRVSGWYKRRVQLILFIVAIRLTAAINADSYSIAQRLWKDSALRGAP